MDFWTIFKILLLIIIGFIWINYDLIKKKIQGKCEKPLEKNKSINENKKNVKEKNLEQQKEKINEEKNINEEYLNQNENILTETTNEIIDNLLKKELD